MILLLFNSFFLEFSESILNFD